VDVDVVRAAQKRRVPDQVHTSSTLAACPQAAVSCEDLLAPGVQPAAPHCAPAGMHPQAAAAAAAAAPATAAAWVDGSSVQAAGSASAAGVTGQLSPQHGTARHGHAFAGGLGGLSPPPVNDNAPPSPTPLPAPGAWEGPEVHAEYAAYLRRWEAGVTLAQRIHRCVC
jgi:hypothetical protein